MQLGIDGVSPGEDTQHVIVTKLVVVRIIGAMALLELFRASRWADACLNQVAGVPLSVIEILIVVGAVTQCYRTVRVPSAACLLVLSDIAVHACPHSPLGQEHESSVQITFLRLLGFMQVERSLQEVQVIRSMKRRLGGTVL